MGGGGVVNLFLSIFKVLGSMTLPEFDKAGLSTHVKHGLWRRP